MSQRRRFQFDSSQLKITRGALIVAGLQVGLSLVWLLSGPSAREAMLEWLAATPESVFHQGRVWTLVTSPFLEIDFLSLLLGLFMLWAFVPTLERFWGTPRFLRFAAITTLVGAIAGTAIGFATDPGAGIYIDGLSPFIFSIVVAFGVVYARQPVQFFGVLPLTGRQMMYGFIGFLVLFIGLQGLWEKGGAFAAAMIAAAILTSKRWSPSLALKRWRIARARARLSVIEGGAPRTPTPPRKKRDDQRFIN